MAAKPVSVKPPALSVRGKRAAKNAAPTVRHRPDTKLDFTDAPELTVDQLKGARRVGRPLTGSAPKQLIAIRIDPELLVALRKMASRQKIGYQSLIQRLLRDAVHLPHIA